MKDISVRGNYHVCPIHGGGPIVQTQELVKINKKYAATVNDKCQCAGEVSDVIVSGSPVLYINGRAAARKSDQTEHGGNIEEGESFFKID